MAMRPPPVLQRLGRLFVVKTRWEAWFVTWAIALGAVERGKHYLQQYPGAIGWMFFAACCGVVFLAGAKLLDSTRAEVPRLVPATRARTLRRPASLSRSRPRASRRPAGSASRS